MSGSASSSPPSDLSLPPDPNFTSPDVPGDTISTEDTGTNFGDVAKGAGAGAAAGSLAGPWGAAAGAVLGAGISIFGQLDSASKQAEIDRQKQDLANEQAAEVINREAINDSLRAQATFKAKLDFGSEFAASGHGGAAIGSQLEIQRQSDIQTAIQDREANFQAYMLRKGGAMQGQLADLTERSGYFNAAGTGISVLGRLASPSAGYVNYGGTQSLPERPSFTGG